VLAWKVFNKMFSDPKSNITELEYLSAEMPRIVYLMNFFYLHINTFNATNYKIFEMLKDDEGYDNYEKNQGNGL